MNILRYIFLILVLSATNSLAAAEQDTLFSPSIRIGADLSGFVRNIWERETLPVEFSVDFEWRKNHFIAAEAGWLNVEVAKETHEYTAGGYFFRAGADFNILERSPEHPNDVLLLSLRYGFGKLDHEAPNIIISDPLWGDYQTGIDAETYSAHWLEAGIGMKSEIFSNVFLGWSLRGRLRVSSTSDPGMEPYRISGFGKSQNTTLTFHYSILYRFPL